MTEAEEEKGSLPSVLISRKEWLIASAVGLTAFLVYLLTLAPTVTGEDSGELAAAAYLGGVAHPPGYPLWCLLGKFFTLLPIGDIAYRTNLVSAVFGALTVAGVYLVARTWAAGRVAAWTGALALAFSQRFWSQAVITEVYTLNTCLFVGILLCLLQWLRDERWRWFYLAAVLFGLSLANHYMLALLLSPGFLFFLWPKRRLLRQNLPKLVLSAALVIPGVLIYAYLPLAAASQPYINWGDPSNWHAFLAHVRRSSYRSLEHGQTIARSIKLLFFGQLAIEVWRQFTPYLLLLVIWGMTCLYRRQRVYFLAGVAFFVLNTVVLLWLLQFSFEFENRQRVQVYYLPAYCILAVFLALGCDRFLQRIFQASERLREGAKARVAVAIAVACLPVLPLLQHFHGASRRHSWIARDYAENLLRQVEDKAVIFPSADSTTFPLIYLVGAEKTRPDVIIGDKYGELDREVLDLYKTLPDRPQRATAAQVEQHIIKHSGRVVYYTDRERAPRLAGFKLMPWGLLYRVVPEKSTEKPPKDLWKTVTFHNIEVAAKSADAMERGLAWGYFRMQGEHELSYGDRRQGLTLLQKSEKIIHAKEEFNNLGSIYARYGFQERARRAWQKALRIYPGYVTPRLNLAQNALARGRVNEAKSYVQEAIRLAPNNPAARKLQRDIEARSTLAPFREALRQMPENPAVYNNLACKLAELKRFPEAVELWHQALKKDPTYAMAHKNLALVYEKELHDPARAEAHKKEYERLAGRPGLKTGPEVPQLKLPEVKLPKIK